MKIKELEQELRSKTFPSSRPFFSNVSFQESLYYTSCPHVLSTSNTFSTVDRDMPSDPKATIEMKIKELESEV